MPTRSPSEEPGAAAWTPGVWADSAPGEATALLNGIGESTEHPARSDAPRRIASPVMIVRSARCHVRVSQSDVR